MDHSSRCPICLESPYLEPCVTTCGHTFCKECITAAILFSGDTSCPYCRQSVSLFEVKMTENGEPVLKQPSAILGGIYKQGGMVGLASYHFESPESCFISYESEACMMWPSLENGDRPPPKKFFVNPVINEAEKTFTGDIIWSPTRWNGDAMWCYEMKFSDDYSQIVGGHVMAYNSIENGELNETLYFGTHLAYERHQECDLNA